MNIALFFIASTIPSCLLAADLRSVQLRSKRFSITDLLSFGGNNGGFLGRSTSSGNSFGRSRSQCSENEKIYRNYCKSAALSYRDLENRCRTRCNTLEYKGNNLQLTLSSCNYDNCECRYCDKRSNSNNGNDRDFSGNHDGHNHGGGSQFSGSNWGAQMVRNEPGARCSSSNRDWTQEFRSLCRDTRGTRPVQMVTCQEECRLAARRGVLRSATCTAYAGDCVCTFCESSSNSGSFVGNHDGHNHGSSSSGRGGTSNSWNSGNGGGSSNGWNRGRSSGSFSNRDRDSQSGWNGGRSSGSFSNRDRDSHSHECSYRDIREVVLGRCTPSCAARCRRKLRSNYDSAHCDNSNRCICHKCSDRFNG